MLPDRLFRNGDIGRSADEALINVNVTTAVVVLRYLCFCKKGISLSSQKRYQRNAESEDYPWGFSFDDLYRGCIAFMQATRARGPSSSREIKKWGGIDSNKKPSNGDARIETYTRAPAASYGRFMKEAGEIPDNLVTRVIYDMVEAFRDLRTREKESAASSSPTYTQAFDRLWKRTGYLAASQKYNQLAAKRSGTSIRRHKQVLDAVSKLSPIDYTTIGRIIRDLYARGLFEKPKITCSADEDVFTKFQQLLPESVSLEQYLAGLERDGDFLEAALEDDDLLQEAQALNKDGDINATLTKLFLEKLKQCHATLSLIPARLPIQSTFEESLQRLGMLREHLEGDEKYLDLRLDRTNKPDGTPVHSLQLKAFQVQGIYPQRWHL